MRSLRYTIEFDDGVKVQMLFTPHLYSFKGTQGVTFDAGAGTQREVFEVYADIMFCAALNAWLLDGNGDVDNFPHKRGDFHEFMVLQPKAYGKALNFALQALTGKSLQDFVKDAQNDAPDAKDKTSDDDAADGSKKKVHSHWIGRLLKRS